MANALTKNTNGDRVNRYGFLFRLMHWVLPISGLVLVVTGLSLHAAARPDWSMFLGKVPGWMWKGRVQLYHTIAALVFVPATIVALWYFLVRPVSRRMMHYALIGSSVLLCVTGFFLTAPMGLPQVDTLVRAPHMFVGLILLPILLLWHLLEALTKYRGVLIESFNPFTRISIISPIIFVIVFAASTFVSLNGSLVELPWRQMHVPRIDVVTTDPVEFADFENLPWSEAEPFWMEMANGVGYEHGRTLVILQALHDGENLYVRCEWDDPAEDRRYWPWKKTEDGWEHLMVSKNDAIVHYEDKFSLLFPIEQDWRFDTFGCALQCHVDADYGWGYKGHPHKIDVWHWKASRTDPVGQCDDKYWKELNFDNKDIGRYGDPKEGGGYTKNLLDGKNHPAYLPNDSVVIEKGTMLADKKTAEELLKYTPEKAAEFKVDEQIPGVLSSAFAGDRADVPCASRHSMIEGKGRWVLYLRRKLDTDSDFDVKFEPGKSYAFGCASFDHAAKRHAYGLPVCWMVFEE